MTPEPPADRGPVAVTGGTGFIGARVLRGLTAAGWRVRALYRPRRGRRVPTQPQIEWVAGSLADPAALARLVAGAHAVIHLAGAVRGARRADFDRVNATGTENLVAAAASADCRRFLLLSSLAAREPTLSDYAASKRAGEAALAAQTGGVRWTILRPPAVYGPGDRELRPLFRGMARGLAALPGAARGRFSLLYVDDLAAAILRWLASDPAGGQTFALDDGHPGGYDWDTVLALAARALRGGRRIARVPIPLPLLRGAAWLNLAAASILGRAPMLTPGKVRELIHPDWVCDGAAFTRATGWRPAFGLAAGLAATFDAVEPQPGSVS
jgi:nucleoside-diphosphate-sugar epimerase